MARAATSVLSKTQSAVSLLSPTKPPGRFVAVVDVEKCAGCGVCLPVCPSGAITIDTVATINNTLCTGCGQCVPHCPQEALRLQVS